MVLRLLAHALSCQSFNRDVWLELASWHRGNDTQFISWVGICAHLEPELREVAFDAHRRPIVDRVTLREHDYPIKELEKLGTGLVNRRKHGHTSLGLLAHQLHDSDGSGRIKTARWLIEQEKRWLRDHLVSN